MEVLRCLTFVLASEHLFPNSAHTSMRVYGCFRFSGFQ